MAANPVTEADRDFAEFLDTLAAAAIIDGDYEMGGYLMDASDWHQDPPPARIAARLMLLEAAGRRVTGERLHGRLHPLRREGAV